MTATEFNKCVDLHSDGVYRFILKNIRDEDKAKDIVQDSFEKMWLKNDIIEFDKCKSYLYTTAYHTMIDLIRRDKKKANWDEVNEYEHTHMPNHYTGVKEIVDQAVSALSDVQRSVILLRDYEGYSYEQISEMTNLTLSQVKVYIFRGRQALKEKLGKFEELL